MSDRSMSVPMTLSDLDRQEERGHFFSGVSIDLERPNSACLEERISVESAALPSQGGGAQALPNLGGSLLFMHTPFDAELPNLTW